jgi:cobaltochelatase CobN
MIGDNLMKNKSKIGIFLVIFTFMVMFSFSGVNAELDLTNNSNKEFSGYSNHDSVDALASIANPKITINVKDAYNESSGKYSDKGFALANASVKIINSSSKKVIYSAITGKDGKVIITSIAPGTYTINISYSSYLSFSKSYTINSNSEISHIFIPDIAFVLPYGGHKAKIDILMSKSKRVYYINSDPDYELDKEWLLDYANFIYLDMYASGAYSFDSSVFKNSPAHNNFKIAYCFGVYDDDTIKSLGLNFIGAKKNNNTPHTLENTFIGSYFKSEVIDGADNEILIENMGNLLAYILYLLGDSKINPTDNISRTPKIDSTWGFYHPDYGIWDYSPSQANILKWIKQNPGYTLDDGSLKWMKIEYVNWQKTNSFENLAKSFENWYNTNKKDLKNNYVVIASYKPGGSLVDSLIRTYESKGRSAFNFFQGIDSPSIASLLLNLTSILNRDIVSINSLHSWSLDYENIGNGGAIDEFTKMNLEIIRGLHDISEYSYMSEFGPQAEWTYAVTIPSFEGVFGAIAVSYLDKDGKQVVMKEGVDKLVETTLGWVNLKEKENEDKKIAIILYNYPPGKAEIGASYLDIFQSIHDLLIQLYDAGYDIGMKKNEIPNVTELYTLISNAGNKGSWAQGLIDDYVEKNWNNLIKYGQLVNRSQYMKYLESLDSALREQLVNYWGSGLGEIMVYNDSYIIIPGLMFGNIFITFQPSRGWEEVSNYHDTTLAPHQQYITFYKWLDDIFSADAMIHLGTHGTLEFLPGRSIGLQADDWTFELMGIPNIYPYIVSNPGEALIAKERAGALLISHMTPITTKAELYGNLTVLEDTINRYEEAIKSNNTLILDQLKEDIIKLVESVKFTKPTKNQNFDEWLDKLHNYLHELEDSLMTLGLHTLGYILNESEMVKEVTTIVSSKTDIYNYIRQLLYPNINLDYYTMKKDSKYQIVTKSIEKWFENFLTALVSGSITDISDFAEKNKIAIEEKGQYTPFYESLLLCSQTIVDIQNNMEWESIINALSGGYILPGLGTDPSYGDSLPTGKNIYSVDTTKMPTEAAFEAAKKIVDKLLVEYYELHGSFPELIGLIIWGTELLRTEGIGLGEFLYLLGAKPIWNKTGLVTGVELIPLTDLTLKLSNGKTILRPRIDVYASAVTSNVNWISLMVTATRLANEANESMDVNYVKKHYKEYASLDRIFGLPGAVLEGTGMSDYIPNTNKWENSTNIAKELAELYLSRVSYAWSIDSNGKLTVTKNREAYEYLLKNVDLISQNLDSSWRFLDSDDYYDWFGGMLGASQYLGNDPNTAIFDIRNKNDIISHTIEEQIELETRTTLLNPLYQEGLLKTPAGWLAYSKKYEYLAALSTVAKGKAGVSIISNDLWDALTENLLSSEFAIDADYKSFAFQSMAGWILHGYRKGTFKGDTKLVKELVDKYIKAVIEYGFACCHHTCGNLEFNKWVISMSSLSDSEKKKYSDMLQKTTNGEAIFKVKSLGIPEQTEDSASDSSSSQGDSQSEEGSYSAEEVGQSSEVSADAAESSNEDSSSDSSSSSQEGGSDSHEVSKSSSNSSEESSMSAAFIGVIIAIIALFAVGYLRNKKNDS